MTREIDPPILDDWAPLKPSLLRKSLGEIAKTIESPFIPQYPQTESILDDEGHIKPIDDDYFSKEAPVNDSPLLFQQPLSSYKGEYPYNHAMVSEGGHIQEFDDTPGNERYRQVHPSGSYTEQNAKGQVIHKAKDDLFLMSDNDICLYAGDELKANVGGNETYYNLGNKLSRIDGTHDHTVVGDLTEKLQSNRVVTISGNDTLTIEGSGSITVKGSITINVEGDANISVNGSANMKVGGNMQTEVGGNYNVNAGGSVNIVAGGNASLDGARVDLG